MLGTKKNHRLDETIIFTGEDRVLDEVMSIRQRIQRCLEDLDRRIQASPEGMLRISVSGNHVQYYHRLDPKDFKGKYIRKKDNVIAEQLARKAFYLKCQKDLKEQLNMLDTVKEFYKPFSMDNVYSDLSQQRKQLIYPVVMSDQEYAAWWLSQEYIGKEFRDNAPEYYTNAGERVRSKSEIIIADKLSKYGIPYRYEYPITTASGIVLHPDFYCLNVRSREEIILEHFGMMDDPDYAENAMKKIDLYHSEGFIQGKNLIATFESREKPLNVKLLEDSIRLYLL